MKSIFENFIAAILSIIFFIIGLAAMLIIIPICIIIIPFVSLFTLLCGDNNDNNY